MDITALKESIPRIKHALEQNWDYCAMGVQQVTLRDPVFTRRGEFVCELELYAGMFSDKSRVKSRILTLLIDPYPPVIYNFDTWTKLTDRICEIKCTFHVVLS